MGGRWIGSPSVYAGTQPKTKRSVRAAPSMLQKWIQKTKHVDVKQRIAAMKALRAWKGKEPVLLEALFVRLVEPYQAIRFLAAQQIARWGVQILPRLKKIAFHAKPKVRWTAAYAISILPKTKDVRKTLVQLLSDSFYRVRMHGVLGLTYKKLSDAEWEAVRSLLRRELHPITRMKCLYVLGFRPQKIVPILAHHMLNDTHPLPRRYAAQRLVLGNFPVLRVHTLLSQALKKERTQPIQLAFLRLWMQWSKRQTKTLAPYVIDRAIGRFVQAKLWTLREAALLYLARKKTLPGHWRASVQKALHDPQPNVRKAARRVWSRLSKSKPSK